MVGQEGSYYQSKINLVNFTPQPLILLLCFFINYGHWYNGMQSNNHMKSVFIEIFAIVVPLHFLPQCLWCALPTYLIWSHCWNLFLIYLAVTYMLASEEESLKDDLNVSISPFIIYKLPSMMAFSSSGVFFRNLLNTFFLISFTISLKVSMMILHFSAEFSTMQCYPLIQLTGVVKSAAMA